MLCGGLAFWQRYCQHGDQQAAVGTPVAPFTLVYVVLVRPTPPVPRWKYVSTMWFRLVHEVKHSEYSGASYKRQKVPLLGRWLALSHLVASPFAVQLGKKQFHKSKMGRQIICM